MNNRPRFNYDAKYSHNAVDYLVERGKQLLRFGVTTEGFSSNLSLGGNVVGIFSKDGERFISVYILKQNCGKGAYAETLEDAKKHYGLPDDTRVITTPQCGIGGFLGRRNIPYLLLDPHLINGKPFVEYKEISMYWDSNRAGRSGLHYMRHVDEGLRVISELGGTERAMRIFALHGLLQETYKEGTWSKEFYFKDVSPSVMIGAMEYRAVANSHLSKHIFGSPKLSEDSDVNMALIADKVQNRKDFETYHEGLHPSTDNLKKYFRDWLRCLGVSEEKYKELVSTLGA